MSPATERYWGELAWNNIMFSFSNLKLLCITYATKIDSMIFNIYILYIRIILTV